MDTINLLAACRAVSITYGWKIAFPEFRTYVEKLLGRHLTLDENNWVFDNFDPLSDAEVAWRASNQGEASPYLPRLLQVFNRPDSSLSMERALKQVLELLISHQDDNDTINNSIQDVETMLRAIKR